MFRIITLTTLVAGVLLSAGSMAQAPAAAPAGSTGLCRDGSYWTGPTKQGACRGHKGVQDWYAGAAAAPAATAAAPAAPAAAPAGAAPAGSTGLCRDGSYWTGPTKKGACRGHKGVQDWYAGSAAAPAAPAATASAAPAPAPAAAAPAPTAAAPAAAVRKVAPASTVTTAPGGGPGLVWVNSSSKVYHCQADKWYGKTKSGAYMSEADAMAQGNRPDHGKACNK